MLSSGRIKPNKLSILIRVYFSFNFITFLMYTQTKFIQIAWNVFSRKKLGGDFTLDRYGIKNLK